MRSLLSLKYRKPLLIIVIYLTRLCTYYYFTMKFHTLLTTSLSVATLTQAAPTRNLVGITIRDDNNHKTGTTFLRADGSFRRIEQLFAHTPLNIRGNFFGTSAELLQPQGGARCIVRGSSVGGDLVLNQASSPVDLNNNFIEPLLLNGLEIGC